MSAPLKGTLSSIRSGRSSTCRSSFTSDHNVGRNDVPLVGGRVLEGHPVEVKRATSVTQP